MADLPPGPPDFNRSKSEGGIPIYYGLDINVTNRSRLNFDGLTPAENKVWYGATSFEMAGEEWSIDAFLNYGGTGQTYLVSQASSGKTFAAKFVKSPDSKEVELVKKFPRQLVQHPNFIRYEMIVQDVRSKFPPASHIIFMEHIPNGELFDFIASPEHAVAVKPVSEGTSRRFLQDIVSGMAECYRCGITHRDLKPENLMLNEEGRIVIIDMDTAKVKATPEASADGPPPPPSLEWTTTVNAYGTPAFNAPEVCSGRKYDCQASDVWSVGVIAFYLHAKLPAFTQGNGIGLYHDISGADNDKFWNKIDASPFYQHPFPQELRKFINCLWQKDPAARPSFRQLEDAIAGGEDTLKTHPGLHWLAVPVNDTPDFIAELRRTKPGIHLNEDKIYGRTEEGAARRW